MEKPLWRIGLVQSRSISFNLVQSRSKTVLKSAFSFNFHSISFNFVLRRSKGLWSVDQSTSERSTKGPLNGRPEELIKTD